MVLNQPLANIDGFILSPGGIDDLVAQIVELCKELEVPAVFAMTRRRLAVLLRKKHRIGCVGIFYYDGAEVGNQLFEMFNAIKARHTIREYGSTLYIGLIKHYHADG